MESVEIIARKNGGEEGEKGCFGRSKVVHKWWLLDSPALRSSTLSFILPSNLDTLAVIMANLPNLRRLFVEARTEAEENEYSRKAFYNLVLFISSVAIFSLTAQRMSGPKAGR
ncbi:hypothetical protein N7447_008713 [Penicillium robsamsonii]|uniref:uncharacterized protein n=1 Tax=Penicillium robsamsonii TaxID=1792511 RepID=UPI002546D4F4|nr:uncharacterized protein N7447_008713 [Penicillium robsamsonii]KAJ5816480.1 hypothetical protein N7447_008713 [Penicillium robsamsonii]